MTRKGMIWLGFVALAGCGGALVDRWDMLAASGSMAFTNVVGTPSFALNFSPTHGSLTIASGPTLTWSGTARALYPGMVQNIQEIQFTFDGAATAGTTYAISSAGTTRWYFETRQTSRWIERYLWPYSAQ